MLESNLHDNRIDTARNIYTSIYIYICGTTVCVRVIKYTSNEVISEFARGSREFLYSAFISSFPLCAFRRNSFVLNPLYWNIHLHRDNNRERATLHAHENSFERCTYIHHISLHVRGKKSAIRAIFHREIVAKQRSRGKKTIYRAPPPRFVRLDNGRMRRTASAVYIYTVTYVSE